MARASDPTPALRKNAATLPDLASGTACKQSSFKVGRGSFFFVGPGAKGQGFKAMFKLDKSRSQAKTLATKEPDRFEVGDTGWVTTRFTAEQPLPKTIWEKWLKESYELTCGSRTAAQKKKVAKKAGKKRASKKR